jgi:hypothetical protein
MHLPLLVSDLNQKIKKISHNVLVSNGESGRLFCHIPTIGNYKWISPTHPTTIAAYPLKSAHYLNPIPVK